jgi:hypothetical protein
MKDQGSSQSPPRLTGKYILRWFSPRWFIFIMGTGALANIFQMLAGKPAGALHAIAVFLLSVALAAFPAAAAFLAIRFFVGLDCILKEWRHSSLIQFYSAISIAAAICATGLLRIPLPYISSAGAARLAPVFWWIALAVGLFFILFTTFQVKTGSHAEPRRALGFWFLPPVGLFVLIFAGNLLGQVGNLADGFKDAVGKKKADTEQQQTGECESEKDNQSNFDNLFINFFHRNCRLNPVGRPGQFGRYCSPADAKSNFISAVLVQIYGRFRDGNAGGGLFLLKINRQFNYSGEFGGVD